MKQLFTIESIKSSPVASRNKHLFTEKKKKREPKARNDCPEVQWMHWQLKYWCDEKGYTLEKELQFAKPKKFRFDFAIKELSIAVEYDGLMSEKSGHTTLVGFTSDTEKINLAIGKGWRVLRFTVINYRNVLQEVEKLIK